MFNTSLRRVARTCSNAPSVPSRPAAPTIASFASNTHQRRHSSSKPPIPPKNGSSAIPAASVKQVGAPRSESKRHGAESRLSKKRSKDKVEHKDTQDDWTSRLPAVPSLEHLNPKDVYVASFFSTHRPMSISGPVPPEASIEAIDKIFQPKPKSRSRTASQDVIYTLASAVEALDEHIAQKQADQHSQNAEQKAALIKALMQRNENPADPSRTHHLDGAPQPIHVPGGNIKLVIQEIQRRFRPFNVPPVPRPISDAEINASEEQYAAQAEKEEEMQAKALEVEIEQQEYNDPYIQQVVINIPRDSSDLQNGGFFTGRGAPMMEIENPDASSSVQEIEHHTPSGRNGMIGRRRQIGSTLGKRKEGMYAISVKRQRRLKMKKHKYKKLMRKTRNLRRKLGQI
ncbi:uncharacterized protein Z519_05553 [Cladophialophora bantiana CBS 173.52]|uniref:Small ribosomal subunit protein mS38 n=1 Tax=Cladophialophora bantiana (strain ATCC 10958 / CBS 173.52 / CDC B-1940 / NIH 8579) TaxID=1442370 RepID=A0A0D2G6K3_CLAB1|nr:uncharacterized protein Z519_05553 [Cladophialophora bantiana CBS 173.52]KIW94237.1 hypothetical protein Z519_05553 [Cladophialophora bantiana CBS 173.52]